ncbi:hypothetical protein AZA_32283 [Nitrospirillum viridazoti Y2]|uniref:Uncharacterized protein n=1 Tax=Nitrospirillum amazonense TaxID=28077 RepID=A0A560IAQ8_9PROT|nr:hypothetical protein [Nitrospirillum amazonense]EGY02532.1 hypothetical protein AZA_32283 [Nitrospirillum amazonense Y2]TWB56117.1 hypothetical protein FBZ92_113111 [Nitrospirillum amazonense]
MALGTIERQHHHYRRGLVLGFTLAEIIILVIFCLLLALAARFIKDKKQIETLDALTHSQAADLEALRAQLGEMSLAFKNPAKIDDMFRELVLLRKKAAQVDALQAQVQALAEKAAQWDAVEQAVKDQLPPGADAKAIAKKTVQEAAIGAAIQQAMEQAGVKDPSTQQMTAVADALKQVVDQALKANPGKDPAAAVRQALANRQDLLAQVANLEGQNKNLRNKLERIGPGLEMPPCWPDKNGKPEYIFDVALSGTSFRVRDRKLPNRVAEQAQLPIQITFDTEIPPSQFLAETEPLKQWSIAHQCRFFVRVFDQTGPNEKAQYKSMLRTVEMPFYKLEVLHDTF